MRPPSIPHPTTPPSSYHFWLTPLATGLTIAPPSPHRSSITPPHLPHPTAPGSIRSPTQSTHFINCTLRELMFSANKQLILFIERIIVLPICYTNATSPSPPPPPPYCLLSPPSPYAIITIV